MSTGLLVYLVLGLLYVIWEHISLEIEFNKATKTQIALFVGQQIVHYLRLWVTWPSYLVEDALLVMMNFTMKDEDNDDDSRI